MMKKMLTTLFVTGLTMTCTIPAFAANQNPTIVSSRYADIAFQVDPVYTVTIPTEIMLEKTSAEDGGVIYKKEAYLSAENVRLEFGRQLSVTMQSDYTLEDSSHTDNTLSYTVKSGSQPIENDQTPLAEFRTSPEKQTSSAITFSANDPTYAGEYKDTVIFTVKVADIPS